MAVPARPTSVNPMMRRSTSGRIRFDISSRSFVVVAASKAGAENPPIAILIEMGLKDEKGQDWSGRAIVTVDDSRVELESGDALVVPRGATRSTAAGSAGVRYLTVHGTRAPLSIGPRPSADASVVEE